MKRAFTVLELIFVVVAVGLISSAAINAFKSNKSNQAVSQVLSSIRYTQHLAMIDNKFISAKNMSDYSAMADQLKNVQYWFKGRWQIRFRQNIGSGTDLRANIWSMSIFSDSPLSVASTEYDQSPNIAFDEIAQDPIDKTKFLTGGFGSLLVTDERTKDEMKLGPTYGVTNVQVTCNNQPSVRIVFDEIGRPYCSYSSGVQTTPFKAGSTYYLANSDINVSITTDAGRTSVITVEKETGYARVAS